MFKAYLKPRRVEDVALSNVDWNYSRRQLGISMVFSIILGAASHLLSLCLVFLWRVAFRGRYWRSSCYYNRGLSDGSYTEILKRRLAEGDIDEVQYDRLVRKLGEGRKVE